MNIENIVKKLEVNYYQNLIDYCKQNNLNYKSFNNSLNEAEKFLSSESETIKVSEKDGTESNNSKEVLFSDDYLFKRPWSKLSSIHKIIKIKEFISKLLVNTDEEEILKNQATILVNKKILSKKDKVKYDSEKGVVIAIPILVHKNGKYSFG